MNDQQSQTAAASAVIYMPVAPRTAAPFHGELHEDVEDWIDQHERIARHNGWTVEQRLQNVYFSLEGTARYWYETHESSLTTWDVFKSQLKATFAN